MRGADQGVDEQVMQAIAADPVEAERQTLALLAAVFIARERGADWAKTLLQRWFGMAAPLIEESPLYQEWMADVQARSLAQGKLEGKAEGLREGEAIGLREGEARGEVHGLVDALTLVLEARFGVLTSDLAAVLRLADPGQLRAVIAEAAVEDLSAIRARFGLSA